MPINLVVNKPSELECLSVFKNRNFSVGNHRQPTSGVEAHGAHNGPQSVNTQADQHVSGCTQYHTLKCRKNM